MKASSSSIRFLRTQLVCHDGECLIKTDQIEFV